MHTLVHPVVEIAAFIVKLFLFYIHYWYTYIHAINYLTSFSSYTRSYHTLQVLMYFACSTKPLH